MAIFGRHCQKNNHNWIVVGVSTIGTRVPRTRIQRECTMVHVYHRMVLVHVYHGTQYTCTYHGTRVPWYQWYLMIPTALPLVPRYSTSQLDKEAPVLLVPVEYLGMGTRALRTYVRTYTCTYLSACISSRF